MNELERWELVKQLHTASNEELKAMYSISEDENVVKAISTILVERKVWRKLTRQEIEVKRKIETERWVKGLQEDKQLLW